MSPKIFSGGILILIFLIFLVFHWWFRPDTDLDPNADKLLHFEGEGSSFGLIWIVVIFIVLFVYKGIGSNSPGIQRSMLLAKQMVAKGAHGGKKMRSA